MRVNVRLAISPGAVVAAATARAAQGAATIGNGGAVSWMDATE